ncbi:hypothetical protein QZM19_19745 [Burkholderia multivorans]|nr:hypothetical protein [Burkholderia multivorans]
MIRNKIATLAISAGLAVCFTSLPVAAQTTSDQGAATTDAQASKQTQKAQKKAERKARHAKKNAELSQLEKNGYNPAGSQLNYPQNLQNAQQKANAQKGAAPAPAQ